MIRMILLLCLTATTLSAAQGSPAAPQGPLASFRLVNDHAAAAAAERPVSFGQVFRRGALKPKDGVRISLNGREAAAQLDAKAFWPDGSVRHAVLTVLAPPVAKGGALEGQIRRDGGSTALRARPAGSAAVPDVDVVLELQGDGGHRTVRAALREIAATAATGDPPWLDGPLVREQRYRSVPAYGLQVVFDVWTPAAGPPRVDVIVHNDSAQAADIGTRRYDAAIRVAGRTAFEARGLTHYAYATWRRTLELGAPPLRMVPDVALLAETGATPNYARFRPAPEAVSHLHRLSVDGARPLGFAAITPYMPTTGGRADIGPLPAWAVFYLADPSRQNHDVLLANGDAAGSIPWHVRDLTTQGPIRIDQHPDVWLDGRGEAAPPVLARKYYTLDTEWHPDDAHQPSLTYLPYLLTGSRYYRDELAMQAGYNLLAIDPQLRDGGEGLLLGAQVRAVAWNLRTLANAAWILPADDPLQGYFENVLRRNLAEIVQRHVRRRGSGGPGELRGYLPGPNAVAGSTAPWQNDYLAMVLGWIAAMGYDDARTAADWMGAFVAGRFNSGPRGYDPLYGTPYYLMVAEPGSERPISTWSEAFEATFDAAKPVRSLDDPAGGGGYAAVARAALASIINATGSREARDAYAWVRRQTPLMDADYSRIPNFAIAPARPADSR
jgi:hypothetical protein